MADLRDNLAAFAKRIGWPLEDWQADSLKLEQRITVYVAPRQSGKAARSPFLACGGRSPTAKRAC